ncbi:alpha/beta fold hydrolase [Neisseria yangbaofengii]|uniref:alpha/beta fold hydrolase n=1 Tax=Neisseria yangbaofengii TaxID=2709396 RepID=UPI00197D8968|nr:alpha/beta hydrolase [Neisseria yangbaofengii]
MKKLSALLLSAALSMTACSTTNPTTTSTEIVNPNAVYTQYATVPTQYITAENGVRYAYRRMGKPQAVPIIYFNHLASNMDNCDPRIMDALAQDFEIICFDYKGVGSTSGKQAQSIQEMAHDSLAFIKALGYEKIDILSFSMGGFISQEIMELKPDLIRKIILAGTGGRGGQGVSDVVGLTYKEIARGRLHGVDSKYFLFFNSSPSGQVAAQDFLSRLEERKVNRDIPAKWSNLRIQLEAISKWGKEQPADLSKFTMPVLVINGDHDRMVPTVNSYDLAKRFPNAQLHIYENSGHGAIFQYHEDFVKRAKAFFANKNAK